MSERIYGQARVDGITVILYLILVICGFLSIYSSSHGSESFSFNLSTQYGKQIIWITASIVLGTVLFLIDVRFFEVFSYGIFGFWMILLFLVIFLGREVNGARSWFAIGSFRLQPAEFAKFGVALALSRYVSDIDTDMKSRRYQIITALIIILPIALIVLQGDAGSGLVFLSFIMVLYREGLSGSILIIGLVSIAVSVLTIAFGFIPIAAGLVVLGGIISAFVYTNIKVFRWLWIILAGCILFSKGVDFAFVNVLQEHQQKRIQVMLGIIEDPQGLGYNVNQSKIAIGSGGFWGKGYLQGTQTKGDFVPEQHTDFIFTSVGEEFGWIGSTTVIVLFVLLFFRISFLAERQRSKFSRVYAYCVLSILFFHFLINIAMTINLAPVIGIPLPFFSYGGSSLISFTVLLFLLLRLDANRENELDSLSY
ncbi:MAG: rod shape-determining protein RodA [Bacteroidia bacterium]|nr:rod shape-determining protein RodA [Bacteroidia bacterium]